MRLYTFHFLGPNGDTRTFELADCADDEAAGAAALEQLRLHPSCVSVDVYADESLVANLTAA